MIELARKGKNFDCVVSIQTICFEMQRTFFSKRLFIGLSLINLIITSSTTILSKSEMVEPSNLLGIVQGVLRINYPYITYSCMNLIEPFDFDKYKQRIQEYGLEFILKIIDIIRPQLPLALNNQEILSLAIMLAGLLTPIAVGSVVTAAELLQKVSLFGIKTGKTTVELTVGAFAATLKAATDVLIVKPIYLLTSPFRKSATDEEVRRMLELCQFKKEELARYRQLSTQLGQESGKLFLIIRQIDRYGPVGKDSRVILGSLEAGDKVQRILPLLRKNFKNYDQESIHLICNRVLLRLDARLSQLPRNDFGAIEIYYVMMETFG